MFCSSSIDQLVPAAEFTQWLFLDMNSFFASVEQQERPELRGRPIAVAPMDSDATCVIAASYAAKPYGVKTGTNIKKAREMCPSLVVIEARPKIYIDYHRTLIETVRYELPEPKTLSIDEIACRLWKNERSGASAVRLALHLKQKIRAALGQQMSSSVGIAPNAFLAKVAAELYKPDGLTLVHLADIPNAFRGLVLRDFPGIGKSMSRKLHAADIHTVAQLYAATEAELGHVWGSVVGRRWWHMLRGSNESDYAALADPPPRGVSNSHVLEPSLRSVSGAETVLMRLLGKAAYRLRTKGQLASRLTVGITYQGDNLRQHSWKIESSRVNPTGNLLQWLPIFRGMWGDRPFLTNDFVPKKVGVSFSGLVPREDITGSLFDSDTRTATLSHIIDDINSRYKESSGRHNTVDIASTFWLNKHAPERIAFKKISDDDRERSRKTT